MGIRGTIMLLLIVVGIVIIAFPYLPKIYDELEGHFTPEDDSEENTNTDNKE